MSCIQFTHFSHSESTTLLVVWGLDDTAPNTGQAVQGTGRSAVTTTVVSTQTKTARAVIPTEATTVVQDNCVEGSSVDKGLRYTRQGDDEATIERSLICPMLLVSM